MSLTLGPDHVTDEASAVVHQDRGVAREHVVRVQAVNSEVVGSRVLQEKPVGADRDGVAVVGPQRHAGLQGKSLHPLARRRRPERVLLGGGQLFFAARGGKRELGKVLVVFVTIGP